MARRHLALQLVLTEGSDGPLGSGAGSWGRCGQIRHLDLN